MTKDKTILFTGTNPKRFYSEGKIVHQPMVALIPLDDYGELKGVMKNISSYDWIIFTSRYAVSFFCERMDNKQLLRDIKVCAIGKATASYLKAYGVSAGYVAEDESAEGIITLLKSKNIKGTNILLPRSNLGRNRLPDALGELGANVNVIVTYQNIKPHYDAVVSLEKIDEIFFTSPSTVRNFLSYYSDIPKGITIFCIGKVTYDEVTGQGLKGEVVTL